MTLKKLLMYSLFFFVVAFVNAQENFNVELISHTELGESSNDCWGWVDSDGIEFAIIGTRTTTKIFSLEDPANPVEIVSVPGTSSTWRDIKTWGNYIYVVADSGEDGLLIIDMTNYKDTIPYTFWQPQLSVGSFNSQLKRSHNIYIDEKGYAYLAGSSSIHQSTGKRGFLILDLFTDPWNPQMVAADTTNYAHDVFVRGDTLYASEIFEGQVALYDVSDKTDIKLMGKANTSFDFTHNAWPSDDGKYVFTTDERGNAFVDAFNIEDVDNIVFLDRFQPEETKNQGVIPHNTHYNDGYLVTSWYTDGIVITDASKPHILVKVGSYDTYGGSHGGFSGCWGAYPFLPSGLILASDINSGLYVLNPNYQRAHYVDGTVRDKDDSGPINNVEIVMQSTSGASTFSDPMGGFGLGQAGGGTYDITFTHPDYLPKTETVTLIQGECISLDVIMQRRAEVSMTLATLKTADAGPVANGKIVLISESQTYEIETDETGNFGGVFFKDDYEIYGGAWGYLHKSIGTVSIDNGTHVDIELEKGYQDDFIFDQGWTQSGDAEAGLWERGVPVVTWLGGEPANVDFDLDGDYGNKCYVTGNGGLDVGFDDVDRGQTRLTSDIMDLSSYNDPVVEYNLWFVNVGGGDPPNDSLTVWITNGTETVMLENLKESSSGWRDRSEFLLSEFIEVNDQMRLFVETGDDQTSEFGHIVEGGLDAFLVRDTETSSFDDIGSDIYLKAYPNPFDGQIKLEYNLESQNSGLLQVYDVLGSLRNTVKLTTKAGQLQIGSDLPAGIYFLTVSTSTNSHETLKVVKR